MLPVIEYMTPALAVTLSVPSQQLPPACTTTTDTTDDNFDISDFVHPQFSMTAVEASASQVVSSLAPWEEFDVPVYNQFSSGTDHSWGHDPEHCGNPSCARTGDRSGNSSGFYCGADTVNKLFLLRHRSLVHFFFLNSDAPVYNHIHQELIVAGETDPEHS